MLIYLKILDSIIGLWAHIIKKIQGLIGIYYQLQSNNTTLFYCLSNGYLFLNLNFDKIQSYINLSYLYFLINLQNIFIQLFRQQFTVLVMFLAIMAYFFTNTDKYNFGWKAHIAHFYFPFYSEIIVVICSILAVAIKDLVVR